MIDLERVPDDVRPYLEMLVREMVKYALGPCDGNSKSVKGAIGLFRAAVQLHYGSKEI